MQAWGGAAQTRSTVGLQLRMVSILLLFAPRNAHVLDQLVLLDLGQVECGSEVFRAAKLCHLLDAVRGLLLAEGDGLWHLRSLGIRRDSHHVLGR